MLHHHVIAPVRLADLEDAHDPRVLEPGEGARLVQDPVSLPPVEREARLEDLEGHLAPQLGVEGQVDLSQPPASEGGEQPEAIEPGGELVDLVLRRVREVVQSLVEVDAPPELLHVAARADEELGRVHVIAPASRLEVLVEELGDLE